MKVAIFSDTYPPEINGVATSARNLFRTMKAHGEDCIVVTTNPFDSEFSFHEGIMRVPGIVMKNLYGYIAPNPLNEKCLTLLKEFQPDVIHIQTDGVIGQMGFLMASKLNSATVYTFHTMMEDYTYYANKGYFDRAAKSVVRSYVRYKSKEADEFITPSEKIREYMRSIKVDAYISVIPTGIDFAAFNRANVNQEKVQEIKDKYGLNNKYVILSLGRIAKEKSIDICLKGYASFLKEHDGENTIMAVVGGGPALDELKSLVADLGIDSHVKFVGPVNPDEVPLYYALGDCFVSASTSETQGLTFMEAMASDNILFARYDETLSDLIKEGEDGFFFFDEHDFGDKLSRIIALSKEEKQKVYANAHIAIEPYSLEQFYQSVKGVYERARKKNY